MWKIWCWIIVYWNRQSYYEIKSKDVYEELFKYKHLFDFNEYKSNILIQQTKKLLAKWKTNLKEFQSINLLDWWRR